MCPRNVSTASTACHVSIQLCPKDQQPPPVEQSPPSPPQPVPSTSTGRRSAVCINAISSGDVVSDVISHDARRILHPRAHAGHGRSNPPVARQPAESRSGSKSRSSAFCGVVSWPPRMEFQRALCLLYGCSKKGRDSQAHHDQLQADFFPHCSSSRACKVLRLMQAQIPSTATTSSSTA